MKNINKSLNLHIKYKDMANIYVSFSPHIAKVLRHELGGNDKAIDIAPRIRCDRYWMKRFPDLKVQDLSRKPSFREMFYLALRVESEEGTFIPYQRAYTEEEYKKFPESDDKRDELVAFVLPKVIHRGYGTLTPNASTLMERYAGTQFRQAAIFFFYDLFSRFLHANQLECAKNHQPFNICEAIHLFGEKYDLSSSDEDALRQQYYRRKQIRL